MGMLTYLFRCDQCEAPTRGYIRGNRVLCASCMAKERPWVRLCLRSRARNEDSDRAYDDARDSDPTEWIRRIR